MNTIERPGIDQKWLKLWKSNSRIFVQVREMHEPSNLQELEQYARHGQTLMGAEDNEPHSTVSPPYKNWESYLDTFLGTYGHMRAREMEVNGVAGVPFDTALGVRSFAAIHTYQMIQLQKQAKTTLRFPGSIGRLMSLPELPYTALGVIIGCKEEAFRLARMQLAAYRKGYYSDTEHYPALHFILRILADYLGEPPLVLRGTALTHPIYNVLMESWREPDAEALVPILLAACDEHTHRTRCREPNNARYEWGPFDIYYDFGDWSRTPIEILLLFKLRQLSGLSNPHIDHPLMNTPLGVLPPEVAFEPDDLIQRVRARLIQDGYDEEAAFVEICREAPHGSVSPSPVPVADAKSTFSRAAPPIPSWSGDLSKLKLREFVSPTFGLVFNVPDAWEDCSTDGGALFGVYDPEGDTKFTASAYEIPGGSLDYWAYSRLGAVESEMPFMKQVLGPYELKGAGWIGIACEYRGTIPNEDFEAHYLVLCLQNDNVWISFTLSATPETFAEHEGLYRWLLQNHLTLRKPGKFVRVES